MFGVPISPAYMNLGDFNYLSDPDGQYSVIVMGRQYFFNDPEFMQGFATGALWAGIDHHQYWSDLKSYDTNITF